MTSASDQVTQSEAQPLGREAQASLEKSIDDMTPRELYGQTFNASCPPDVQPHTRIVAVCGITDIITDETVKEIDTTTTPTIGQILKNSLDKSVSMFSSSRRQRRESVKNAELALKTNNGTASPIIDGWFFSDFYLFHHLFYHSSAYQSWLTCESPETLVRKYGQYTHGTPEDRRIVLDAKSLPVILQQNNIEVVPRAQLLEHFLRIFRDECTIASREGQSILLLVFGHGDAETSGIAIGGTSEDCTTKPRLSIKTIKQAIRGLDVNVSLMITSAYSGGWLYDPAFYVTPTTAASLENRSFSMPRTIGGRFYGSLWAKDVTKAFVKMELQRMTQSCRANSAEVDLDDDENFNSTFANLSVAIKTLINQIDPTEGRHQVRFSVKDDAWEQGWKKRSGVPLEQFERQWGNLRQVSSWQRASSALKLVLVSSPSKSLAAPLTNHFNWKKSVSKVSSLHAVTALCHAYLQSYPGRPNAAPNTGVHGIAGRLVAGETEPDELIRFALKLVSHRMVATQIASNYRKLLSLDYPDCHEFCVEEWESALLAEDGAYYRLEMNPKYRLYQSYFRKILHAHLFPPPPTYQFLKPLRYLACAFVDNGKTPEEVSRGILVLLEEKNTYIGQLIKSLKSVQSARNMAQLTVSILGKGPESPSSQ